ncbi:hypothetical protein ACFFIX_00475 [Metabacillus herbersteinensis]|uniref:Aldolase n=1 Tax=Metabacillus herbersteinensis TaxID=283816 RepID=A0ABV6G8E6_9BACI
MHKQDIKIGEHIFQIISESTEVKAFFRKSFILINNTNLVAKQNMEVTIEFGFGVPFVDYEVKIEKKENNISFFRADYFIEVNSDYTKAKMFIHNELALKHALMNLYSSYIVHMNWGLLIHSSCVIEQQKAYIFSGQSGAGKSTVAKLSYPRPLLSDEATIVKITQEKVTVFHSPFRSEIEGIEIEKPIPLSSVHLLHQSLINEKIEMKKSNGILNLMDKVFFWTHDSEEAKSIFYLLKNLVDNIPVYEFYFQKNNTFWEMIPNEYLCSKELL